NSGSPPTSIPATSRAPGGSRKPSNTASSASIRGSFPPKSPLSGVSRSRASGGKAPAMEFLTTLRSSTCARALPDHPRGPIVVPHALRELPGLPPRCGRTYRCIAGQLRHPSLARAARRAEIPAADALGSTHRGDLTRVVAADPVRIDSPVPAAPLGAQVPQDLVGSRLAASGPVRAPAHRAHREARPAYVGSAVGRGRNALRRALGVRGAGPPASFRRAARARRAALSTVLRLHDRRRLRSSQQRAAPLALASGAALHC